MARPPSSTYYYSPEHLKQITTNPAGTNAERFVVMSIELALADAAEGSVLIQPIEMAEIDNALRPYGGLMRSVALRVLQEATVADLTDRRRSFIDSLHRPMEELVIIPHLPLKGRQMVLKEVIVTEMIVQ